MAVRVAVVGARCRNQGIGAHLARFFVQAGADVCAVLGTGPDTAVEAAEALTVATGHHAAPHVEWDAMLAACAPEAVVIATPHETHTAYLDHALDAKLHVLCEKPLTWGEDAVPEAERLADAFFAQGLHLRVNTQWPETLPTYRELFPETPDVPRHLAMRMSPRSQGLRMIPAAIPHVLSLLAAALPAAQPRIEGIQCSASEDRVALQFVYAADPGAIEAEVELIRCPEQPRPAWYGFDGRIAHRHVEMDSYSMYLEGNGRRIPLPDPTPLLVGSFLDQVAAGPPARIDPAAVPGMRLLAQIHEAACRQTSSPTP